MRTKKRGAKRVPPVGRREPKLAPVCDECKTPLIPIEYGEPSVEGMRKAEAGLIILGGCVVDAPRRGCPRCDPRFRGPLDADARNALAHLATVLVALLAGQVRDGSLVARFLHLDGELKKPTGRPSGR